MDTVGHADRMDLERGMNQNCSVLGENSKIGPNPFKDLRRQNGQFWPYPCGTRRIFTLNTLKNPCGASTPSRFLRLFSTKIQYAPRPKPYGPLALGADHASN